MLTENSRAEIAPDTLFRDLGGEAIVLSLRGGKYYGLDQVGTRYVQLVAEHGQLSTVHKALVQEYDAPPQRLWEDLVRLVTELRDEGLVVVQDAQSDSTSAESE